MEKIEEQDRLHLEMAKMNKKMATVSAEKAIAQAETAELQYKYIVLQLYMRYGLSAADGIDESGNIVRGAVKDPEAAGSPPAGGEVKNEAG